MQKARYGIFIPAILFLLVSISTLYAEGHIVIERTFKYMSRTYPKTVTNLWFGENSFTINAGRTIIIYRKDLGKIWTILTKNNRYYESLISESEKPETNEEETVSIHKLGQNYEPVFDWIIKPGNSTENVGGFECNKITANGDADYAEINIDIWTAKNTGVVMNDLLKTAFKYMADDNWRALYKLHPELKDLFIVKSIDTLVSAIAPDRITEKEMKIETNVTPPGNIFELPKGCVKVNSINELYN